MFPIHLVLACTACWRLIIYIIVLLIAVLTYMENVCLERNEFTSNVMSLEIIMDTEHLKVSCTFRRYPYFIGVFRTQSLLNKWTSPQHYKGYIPECKEQSPKASSLRLFGWWLHSLSTMQG